MNILITGASRGIGAELALQLAADKHQLILLARSEKKLREICHKCNVIAGTVIAHPIAIDLIDLEQNVKSFISALSKHVQSIDVLVNNAGMLIRKPFDEISSEESRSIFNANYFAPEFLIKTCLPFLKKSDLSSIVNVTSMAAVQGSSKFAGLSAYSASKGALATLTECLAEEFKEYNIHVNALAFGAVQTEMLAEAFPGFEASTSANQMGDFFKWFVCEGWKRFNGKMLQVSDSTP
jgi:short-subunit dehydrogenase